MTPNPLNPLLYEALVRSFGQVRIVRPGEQRLVSYVPDYSRGGRAKASTDQYGEQYQVSCCLCGDTKGKLWISYEYGLRDPTTGSPNRHLFHCHRRGCHERHGNAETLYRRLQQAGYQASSSSRITKIPTIVSPAPRVPLDEQVALPATLPSGTVPLDCADAQAAREYLVSRGFDPAELSRTWNVGYCEYGLDVKPQFTHRLVVQIYTVPRFRSGDADATAEPVLAGWAAREISAGPPGDRKYLFCRDMKTSMLLYGLPQALTSPGPILVCEGVADCWAYGPGAVAIFGKTMSVFQRSLLRRHFHDRAILVALDADATKEAIDIVRDLRPDWRDGLVVRLRMPPGRKDPGECSREELVAAVEAVLAGSHAAPPRREPHGDGVVIAAAEAPANAVAVQQEQTASR